MSTDPRTPRVELVSLWDLLFWLDPSINDYRARFNGEPRPNSYDHIAYELSHNIIVFNDRMYANTGATRQIYPSDAAAEGTTFDEFCRVGFDLCPAIYDKRSKPAFLHAGNVAQVIKPVGNHTNATLQNALSAMIGTVKPKPPAGNDLYAGFTGLRVFDRNAAMRPVNTYDFYTKRAEFKGSIDSNASDADTWLDYGAPYNVATDVDFLLDGRSGTPPNNCDIMVCFEDHAFAERFQLNKTDGWRAFNGLALNYMSKRVMWLAWKALGTTELDYTGITDPIKPFLDIGNLNDNDPQNPMGRMHDPTGNISRDACNPIQEYVLRNTFVWVKCSFYADYVDYRDFDQSLNRLSDVIHRNVLVGAGNYARYDAAFTRIGSDPKAVELAKDSRPYIPISIPGVDLVSSTLYDGYDPVSPVDSVEKMMIEADKAMSRLGSIIVEPLEMSNSPDILDTPTRTNRPPPVWFDPESRRPANDYTDHPIAVGKWGNIVTQGRIMSPTIDELWIAIKKLAGGRNVDPTQAPTNLIVTPDIGYPVGQPQGNPGGLDHSIPRDTRFVSKKHKFSGENFSNPAAGANGDRKTGDPIKIEYDFSETIGKYSVVEWINDPSFIAYKDLAELTALSNRMTIDGATSGFGATLTSVERPHTNAAFQTSYNPSETIWSLREVEAAIKGLRWNVTNLSRFFELNLAYSGKVGRPNADPTIGTHPNLARGSAYTLHRDFNPNTHNTVYDNRYDSAEQPYPTRGRGVQLLVAEEIPDFQLTTPPRRTNYPASSAYIAADGYWRSTWQMVNVPVISRVIEQF